MLLDQVLGLPAGAVDRFINVFGIAALQRGDDVADIDASAQHVIGVAGAGLDPGYDPPLLVPRLGRVARLGKAAQNLGLYMSHATMENRHGLAAARMVTLATGTAERRASETMLNAKAKEAGRRILVGEDKAYDIADHVANLRALNVTPHVAQNDSITSTGKRRQSAIDGRTTRHEGYGLPQSCRAMIECISGWGKQHGTMRKTKHRGIAAVAADFLLNLIAYNLIRIPKLVAA